MSGWSLGLVVSLALLILSINRLAECHDRLRASRWLELLEHPRARASCLGVLASLIPARRSTRLEVLDAIQAT